MALSECTPVSTDHRGRELVTHGTALFPVACYHDNISRQPVTWHWHEELEALVVRSGTARVGVNGGEYHLGPGDGLFINTGVLHSVWDEGEETCLLDSAVFHPRLVGGGMDSILWQKYLEPLLSDRCRPCVVLSGGGGWESEAAEAVLGAWQACAREAEGFEFQVRERLSRLIFLLAQNVSWAEAAPSRRALLDAERTKRMLQYIQEHYREEVTLAEVAASANLSKSECLRCFRQMTGSTPIQYVRQVRVQRAVELLMTTDWMVVDICHECGFQVVSYFAKTFREIMGCTPGVYRRWYREGRRPGQRRSKHVQPQEIRGDFFCTTN